MSDKVYLGRNMAQLDTSPALDPVSKVVLLVDDENAYTAGNDTGRTVELTCPYGTQAMANSILASLRAYAYTPLQAQDALLDPAAELGDGLTAGGVYTVLGQMDLEWDALMASDSGAPGQAEQESEYQYRSPVIAELNYQIAETRSTITKTAEEIRLEVENELEGLSSSFTVQLDSIKAEVRGLDGQISTIEQYVDSITLTVSNGDTYSSIQLKAGSAVISSQTIYMSGLVTFTGLADGTTTINGGCIKTGLIDADRLNLTGAITFGDLSSSVRNDINDAYSMAQDAQTTASDAADVVGGWTYRGTTYIDGTRIMTGTVTASTLEGGEIILLDSRGNEAGTFTLDGSSSASGQKVELTSSAIELNAVNGDIYLGLYGGQAGYVQISDDGVTIGRVDLQPNLDNRYYCGTSGQRWAAVYAASSTIVTSDRNLKNSITYEMAKYDAFFERLRPTPYKYNDGTSGRTHLGLISQDVEAALAEAGLTDMDFAGFVKGRNADGDYTYSLRYEEFIALLIYRIQRQDARIKELEESL